MLPMPAPSRRPDGFSIDARSLKIIALEGPSLRVEAQFNPKEIQIDEAISWQKQVQRGAPHLEYTSGDPRSMSFELLFDGFEKKRSVKPQLEALHQMAQPMADPKKKRPPKLRVVWGSSTDSSFDLPSYTAVIESLSIKYTMFSPDGLLLRATANVKLKEASFDLTVGKPK